MKFEFDKSAWTSIEEGEKNCYLMSNGLGGYNSMNLLGGLTRGDQAFFMAAKKAPNVRWNMIPGLVETLVVDGDECYSVNSQRMEYCCDDDGYRYLESFTFDNYPEWVYDVEGIRIKKTIVMVHGENTVAVRYELINNTTHEADFCVEPLLRMTPKNTAFDEEDVEEYHVAITGTENFENSVGTYYTVTKDAETIYVATNGKVKKWYWEIMGPFYYSQDDRDGRKRNGKALLNHEIRWNVGSEPNILTCIFSTEPITYKENWFEEKLQAHKDYMNSLMKSSMVTSELGRQLAVSADAYVSERESTNGKTILAGFPFFEDWGRDTMIALPGITMVTGRFEECKSILRTFARYVHKGLLPNLFPEGDCNPMYNSVDAPLLFINAAYEYVTFSEDEAFIEEIFPVLEQIVEAYKNGTDFHIKMDSDSLIQAGAELEQLTWMDVRVGDHLPTPRHGKPVEINAYWYSALWVMAEFAKSLGKTTQAEAYVELSEKVKVSFLAKFWNEEENCLKDVLSGTSEENQVRCNQIWALTQPFTMLDAVHEKLVIEKVREELYTTIGLRTLSPKDPAFHEIYIGPVEQRDRAYHQGTTWAFPLGAYYRACIRYMKENDFAEKAEWQQHIKEGMEKLNDWLKEGCLAQIAEIYDGKEPTISRGCYAQAWSVGELLRAVYDYEVTVQSL